MKKVLLSFAIMAIAATMTACGNKQAQNTDSTSDASPAMRLLNSVPFTEEGLISMVTTPEKGTLTPEEYEAMYLAYSKVAIDEKTMELEKTSWPKLVTQPLRIVRILKTLKISSSNS